MKGNNEDFWRRLVADAVTIQCHHITQLSPDGFWEAMGKQSYWWTIELGKLSLCRDGAWVFRSRDDNTKERLRYAFKNGQEALTALRESLFPDEPMCAEEFERTLNRDKKP